MFYVYWQKLGIMFDRHFTHCAPCHDTACANCSLLGFHMSSQTVPKHPSMCFGKSVSNLQHVLIERAPPQGLCFGGLRCPFPAASGQACLLSLSFDRQGGGVSDRRRPLQPRGTPAQSVWTSCASTEARQELRRCESSGRMGLRVRACGLGGLYMSSDFRSEGRQGARLSRCAWPRGLGWV